LVVAHSKGRLLAAARKSTAFEDFDRLLAKTVKRYMNRGAKPSGLLIPCNH
jgi:hypothetical protein